MKFRSIYGFALACVMVCSGCNLMEQNQTPEIWNPAVKMPAKKKSNKPEEIKYGDPVRMAIVWSDSVYTAADAPPTRGFGGRIYFYDANNKPVRADGQLDIYAYNDSDHIKRNQADRRYEYKRDEFQKHHSVSDLGDSYSVWVPWDRVGGQRLSVTLIPMFRTADNRLIRGGQDIVVLRGTARDEDEIQKLHKGIPAARTQITKKYPAKQVSHLAPNQVSQNSSVRTTTIKMNRQLGQKLANLPPTVPTTEKVAASIPQAPKQEKLPPGVSRQMLSELQKHNGGSRVTYGGFNRNVGLPPNASQNPATGTSPKSNETQVASLPTGNLPPAPHQQDRSRVFGMPGSYR